MLVDSLVHVVNHSMWPRVQVVHGIFSADVANALTPDDFDYQ